MHFINYSDQEVVIHKHSYVGVMEKVQESDQDMYHTDNSLEPLISMHYLNALPKVTFSPTNVTNCTRCFRKTLVSSYPLLLILPVPSLSNTISVLGMQNSLNRDQFTPVTTIVMKLKSRWKKCYKTTLLNLLLVLGPALLCWLGKQIKHYDSV